MLESQPSKLKSDSARESQIVFSRSGEVDTMRGRGLMVGQ